jgi:hypothetical protein
MKLSFSIVPGLILILSACTQKKNDLTGPTTYFPNRVSDQYTYRVSDSIYNKSYNVSIRVDKMSNLDNGKPVTMWIYSYPDHKDTSYVSANQDSVVFYGNRQTSISKIDIINVYQFPLRVGSKWRTSFIGDTSTVVSLSEAIVVGKVYPNTYKIHDYGHSYNYSVNKVIWYTPYIGMIRMDYKTFGANESWQLVNHVIY